jgi:hypothetical protein
MSSTIYKKRAHYQKRYPLLLRLVYDTIRSGARGLAVEKSSDNLKVPITISRASLTVISHRFSMKRGFMRKERAARFERRGKKHNLSGIFCSPSIQNGRKVIE